MSICRALEILVIFLVVVLRHGAIGDSEACTVYRQSGDITLGALLSLHGHSTSQCEAEIRPHGVVHAEAMAWAVRDINRRDDILPNITLGFEIRDDCRHEDVALWMTLMMVGNITPDAFQDACSDSKSSNQTAQGTASSVIGIIGTSRSATSIPVAQLAGLFELPIMSFWASSNELSDKARFPYFLRTVPPDRYQISAIVDMIVRFQWNYIALIHSVDSYGLHGARELFVLAEKRGICIAFTSPVNENPTEKELTEVVDRLARYKYAKVVVMFAALQVANAVLGQVKRAQPELVRTWIGGDDWGFDLTEKGLGYIAQGSLFTRFYSKVVPSFESHFAGLQAGTDSVSPWFKEYTRKKRETLGCRVDDAHCHGLFPDNASHAFVVSPVVDGVYAFARALDSLLTDTCPDKKKCTQDKTLSGEKLKLHLLQVNFTGTGGLLFFDEKGDPPGKYILKNFQKTDDGKYESIEIGLWNSQSATTRLQLREDLIRWQNGSTKVPRSTCIPDCEVGFIRVPSTEKCCWVCQQCRENEIVVNNNGCVPCNLTKWPSANRTFCADITPNTLDFTNPITITILFFSGTGLFLATVTAAGLAYYRSRPLVKAASRELSVIVLIGVDLAFCAVFMLLVKPTKWTCLASEAAISLSFTLTYAPTLLKVNRIYRIFKASRASVRRPRWVSPRKLVTIASAVIFAQILIIVVATSISPVQPKLTIPATPVNYLELYCSFSYEFLASCVYNLALILVCCFYAFKTRRVPDNYNESKFIAISVYSTLVVCLAMLPVYVTAVAVIQKVATLCAAVLLNGYLTLVCVYLPKLYAVRFVPKKQHDVHSTIIAATQVRGTGRSISQGFNTEGGLGAGAFGQIHPL